MTAARRPVAVAHRAIKIHDSVQIFLPCYRVILFSGQQLAFGFQNRAGIDHTAYILFARQFRCRSGIGHDISLQSTVIEESVFVLSSPQHMPLQRRSYKVGPAKRQRLRSKSEMR